MQTVTRRRWGNVNFKLTVLRWRHWSTVLVVAIVLVPFLVEVGRGLWVWRLVSEAARFGQRYGVTQEFQETACTSPCNTDWQKDDARLQSIYAVVRQALAPLGAGAALDQALQITVCGDGRGFTFDVATHTCLPRDDVGAAGQRLLVYVRYNYAVGGWLGEGLATIPIEAYSQGINETFRVARVEGLPPTMMVVQTQVVEAMVTPLPNGTGQESARLVVVTGDVQLVVADVGSTVTRITTLAKQAGGYVVQSNQDSNGGQQVANLTLRIPVDQFEAVLAEVKTLAQLVVHEQTNGQDVTEEYVDLEARLRSLQATAAQLDAILAKAETVDDALNVSLQRGNVQTQIEQVLGRQQYLNDQVALSTLNVTLSTQQPTPVPAAPLAWQPGSTAEKATRFLVAGGYFVGDLLIWVVIVVLPIVLIVSGVVWVTRRLRGRARQP